MRPLAWEGDPPELKPYCSGGAYSSSTKDDAFRCTSAPTYCGVTPTALTQNRSSQVLCSMWVDEVSGKAVAYRPGSGTSDYEKRLQAEIAAGRVRPGTVWCTFRPSSGVYESNNTEFRDNCVAETAFTCDPDTFQATPLPFTDDKLRLL